MTILLTVGWLLTVAGFLFYLHVRDQREASERAELYQRIQAPQMAVMQHADAKSPPSLPFDDDEAFRAALEDQHAS